MLDPVLLDVRLIPLFVASAVSLGLGVVAWRRRAPGAHAFAVLLTAIALWASTSGFEMVAADLAAKFFWDQMSYVASAAVGPAWLLFTLSYTSWQPRRGRRAGLVCLVVAFLLNQVLVWTDQGRALMWTHAGLDNLDVSLPLKFDYGLAYWAVLAYDYLVLLSGVWLIARTLVQSGRLYSRQALALLVGVAAPLAANIVYQADLVGTIDPTPFAFTITGLAFFWGFLRFGFLDLAPVARNSIFQVLRDAVVVLDRLDRIVDVNPAAELVLGRAATDAVGKPLAEVLRELSLLVEGVTDTPVDNLELKLVDSRDTRHHEVRVSLLHGRGSSVSGRVIVLSDVTLRKAAEASVRASQQLIEQERKQAEEVLAHQASHDALTDLPNRALFQARLLLALGEAARNQTGMALLVVDLDHFKEVNDTLGHAIGDRLLQELGPRWQALLREGDTLARVGGDEFAVVLPTTSDRQVPSLVAHRLQRALLQPFAFDGHALEIGASIGIALYPDHGHDVETLLRHADGAMYAAKRASNARGVSASAA